jgi:hypothetical protein
VALQINTLINKNVASMELETQNRKQNSRGNGHHRRTGIADMCRSENYTETDDRY